MTPDDLLKLSGFLWDLKDGCGSGTMAAQLAHYLAPQPAGAGNAAR